MSAKALLRALAICGLDAKRISQETGIPLLRLDEAAEGWPLRAVHLGPLTEYTRAALRRAYLGETVKVVNDDAARTSPEVRARIADLRSAYLANFGASIDGASPAHAAQPFSAERALRTLVRLGASLEMVEALSAVPERRLDLARISVLPLEEGHREVQAATRYLLRRAYQIAVEMGVENDGVRAWAGDLIDAYAMLFDDGTSIHEPMGDLPEFGT